MFESGIMEQVLETYFGGDNEFKRYDKGIQIMEHIAQVDPDATLKRMKMYGEQVPAESSVQKVCPLVYTIEFVKQVFNKYGENGLFFQYSNEITLLSNTVKFYNFLLSAKKNFNLVQSYLINECQLPNIIYNIFMRNICTSNNCPKFTQTELGMSTTSALITIFSYYLEEKLDYSEELVFTIDQINIE